MFNEMFDEIYDEIFDEIFDDIFDEIFEVRGDAQRALDQARKSGKARVTFQPDEKTAAVLATVNLLKKRAVN